MKVKVYLEDNLPSMSIEHVSIVDSEPTPGTATPMVNSKLYSWSKHQYVEPEESENEIFFSDEEEIQEKYNKDDLNEDNSILFKGKVISVDDSAFKKHFTKSSQESTSKPDPENLLICGSQ